MGRVILGLLGLAALAALVGSEGDQKPPPARRRRVYYRTRDGRADYRFSLEAQPNGDYRIYIESQPSYRGRNTSAITTHRLSGGGRQYICWTTTISSEQQARQVASRWADATQEYIRTGKGF